MTRGPHLTVDMRMRAVEELRDGKAIGEVAREFGIDRTTVYRWRIRVQREGKRGLHARPRSGRPQTLAGLNARELKTLLVQPATRFGFKSSVWTISRIAKAISARFGIAISHDTVWRRLRDIGLYRSWELPLSRSESSQRRHWLRAARKHRAVVLIVAQIQIPIDGFVDGWKGVAGVGKPTRSRHLLAGLAAVNTRKRLILRLFRDRITPKQVSGFLRDLQKHHPNRQIAVVTERCGPTMARALASQSRLRVFDWKGKN